MHWNLWATSGSEQAVGNLCLTKSTLWQWLNLPTYWQDVWILKPKVKTSSKITSCLASAAERCFFLLLLSGPPQVFWLNVEPASWRQTTPTKKGADRYQVSARSHYYRVYFRSTDLNKTMKHVNFKLHPGYLFFTSIGLCRFTEVKVLQKRKKKKNVF